MEQKSKTQNLTTVKKFKKNVTKLKNSKLYKTPQLNLKKNWKKIKYDKTKKINLWQTFYIELWERKSS